MSKRFLAALVILGCVFALVCCGSSNDSPPAPQTGQVTVSGASS